MKIAFVVYLSGKTNKTMSQRWSQDSVASSVALSGKQAEFFHGVAQDCTNDEDATVPTKAMQGKDFPVPLCPGALGDMCSDLVGNEDQYSENARMIGALCESSALCNYVYLVVGDA